MRGLNPALLSAYSGILKVTVSPDYVYGFANLGYGSATAVTPNITAIASGGSAPYAYTWSFVSGSSVPTLINLSPGVACWQVTSSTPDSYIAIWRCVVVDAALNVVYSQNVTVEIEINP